MYKEGRKTIYEPGDLVGPYQIEFIEEIEPKIYPKYNTKIRQGYFKCPICKNPHLTRISEVNNGRSSRCKECSHIDNLIGQKFNKLTVIELVQNNKKGAYWKCKCDCGNITIVSGSNLKKNEVKSCGCLMKDQKTFELRGQRIRKNDLQGRRFGNLVALELTDKKSYRGSIWKCQCDCGNITYIARDRLITGNTSSCGCLKSKGEQKLQKIFVNLNIKYNKEYTFKKCINPETQNLLRFDFFLPKYNCCIEYDGKQHFKNINYWGGKKGLTQRQYNDEIKNQYCKDNNIKLIRIPYWDYDKLNEEYLLSLIEG